MSLTLTLSPSFSLARSGETIQLSNKKAQALLIYLVLTGQPHSREHLATLLWGDRFDEQARNSLRQALFALRKAVGDGVVIGDDPLKLDEASLEVTPAAGELLVGYTTRAAQFDDWLSGRRDLCNQAALTESVEQAEQMLKNGDPKGALGGANMALALDAYAEPALRLKMRCLTGLGQKAEAVRVYDAFSEQLHEQLDTEPSAETIRLAADLRHHAEAELRTEGHKNEGRLSKVAAIEFEDLGGGDVASFLAQEIPREIASGLATVGYVSAGYIAANTAKGVGEDPKSLAMSNGTYYIFTGSVRQIGEKVRIRVNQEFLGVHPKTAWTENWTISEGGAFEFLDRVFEVVNGQLYYLSGGDDVRATEALHSFETNPESAAMNVDDYLNCFWLYFINHHSREGLGVLAPIARKVADANPNNATILCLAGVALHHHIHLGDRKDRLDGYRAVSGYLRRARAIEPTAQAVRHGIAMYGNWEGRFNDVEQAYNDMMEAGQNLPSIQGLYGVSLMFRGRFDEALPRVHETVRRESGVKFLMYRYPIISLSHFFLGDFAKAEEYARYGLEVSEEFCFGHLAHIAALTRLGRADDARRAVDRFRQSYRNPTVSEWEWLPFTDSAHRPALLDALREAGLPD